MSNHTHYIANQLIEANLSIRLFIGSEDFLSLLEDVKKLNRQNIAVELFIKRELSSVFEKDVFLLNKIFQLREEGASVYTTKLQESYSCILQTDFTKTVTYPHEKKSQEFTNGQPEHSKIRDWFKKVSHSNEEFQQDREDIIISFTAEDENVINNSSTTIHWDVENADHVEIVGIGSVPNKGAQSLKFIDDTIITLKAQNKRASKIKALYIQTHQEVIIDYKLSFLNPSSKKFVKLQELDNQGVFGVAKDQKIKFEWNVSGAESTSIDPFKLKGNTGSHIFHAQDPIEIIIIAAIQGIERKKRLILQAFPQPVLSKYEVPLNIEFKNPDAFSYANWYEKLSQKSDHFISSTSINERLKNNEKEIWEKYSNLDFSRFYEKHSITRLNKSILSRIKDYFEEQPRVTKIIEAIKYHHEEGK